MEHVAGKNRGCITGSPWSDDEIRTLRDNYEKSSVPGMMALLPGRTESAIRKMARSFGLKRDPDIRRQNHSTGIKRKFENDISNRPLIEYDEWTAEEDATLRGMSEIDPDIFEHRESYEVYARAYFLWLQDAPVPFCRPCEEMPPFSLKDGWNFTYLRKLSSKGHVQDYVPGYPRADKNGWVFEHVLVWEMVHGRNVPSGCVVHHDDRDKLNNAPENLIMMTNPEHMRLHAYARDICREAREKMYVHAKERFSDITDHPSYVPVDVPEACRMLDSGMTWKQVRVALGVSSYVLARRLSEAAESGDADATVALAKKPVGHASGEVVGRGRPSPDFDVSAAKALLDDGVPVFDACSRMGVSYSTFRRYLKMAGVRYVKHGV